MKQDRKTFEQRIARKPTVHINITLTLNETILVKKVLEVSPLSKTKGLSNVLRKLQGAIDLNDL